MLLFSILIATLSIVRAGHTQLATAKRNLIVSVLVRLIRFDAARCVPTGSAFLKEWLWLGVRIATRGCTAVSKEDCRGFHAQGSPSPN